MRGMTERRARGLPAGLADFGSFSLGAFFTSFSNTLSSFRARRAETFDRSRVSQTAFLEALANLRVTGHIKRDHCGSK